MAAVEPTSEELFSGLGKHAETHLPPEWAARRDRLSRASFDALVMLVELSWVVALGYAAYRFLS